MLVFTKTSEKSGLLKLGALISMRMNSFKIVLHPKNISPNKATLILRVEFGCKIREVVKFQKFDEINFRDVIF